MALEENTPRKHISAAFDRIGVQLLELHEPEEWLPQL
jgi:hypothetical protein